MQKKNIFSFWSSKKSFLINFHIAWIKSSWMEGKKGKVFFCWFLVVWGSLKVMKWLGFYTLWQSLFLAFSRFIVIHSLRPWAFSLFNSFSLSSENGWGKYLLKLHRQISTEEVNFCEQFKFNLFNNQFWDLNKKWHLYWINLWISLTTKDKKIYIVKFILWTV